ncbi:MAG TPA: hypothetical protein VES58_02225, partial [Syntrophobacteria bacterium]|nr:hypothetical protein [Syntrophobacteria bacterium]
MQLSVVEVIMPGNGEIGEHKRTYLAMKSGPGGTMEHLLALLEELSTCPGPPGGEEPVAQIIRRYLEAFCEIRRD